MRWLLLLLLLCPFASAVEYDTRFILEDFAEETPIRDVYVNATVQGEVNQTAEFTVGDDNQIELLLPEGSYLLTLKVDDQETLGKDYFIRQNIVVSSDETLTLNLFKTGSIRGEVVYENDESVANATVDVRCTTEGGETTTITTTASGNFWFDWLPVGLCEITAVKGYYQETIDANIEHGTISKETIVLQDPVDINTSVQIPQTQPEDDSRLKAIFFTIPIIVILLAILIFASFNQWRQTNKMTEQTINQRQHDILQTLKPQERQVVEFLIEEKGRSSQAMIKNETAIPKTTLSRLLETLEHKNIIQIKKVGKLKKVFLTDFFKGEDLNGPIKKLFERKEE